LSKITQFLKGNPIRNIFSCDKGALGNLSRNKGAAFGPNENQPQGHQLHFLTDFGENKKKRMIFESGNKTFLFMSIGATQHLLFWPLCFVFGANL
jgi:hypothetical protein